MTCAKGHPKQGPGRCKACHAEANRRWRRTPQGVAYQKRWASSERGKESHRRAQAKYEEETMTGFQYNLKLLKHRRWKQLKAKERRQKRDG